MELAEFNLILSHQAHHWWYRSLHAFVGDFLENHLRPPLRCLDIGAGAGGLIQSLKKRFPESRFVAIDPSPVAIEMLQSQQIECCRGDFASYGEFDNEGWDVILATDSLYFLKTQERIREALEKAHRGLRPGGLLLLQTAAHPSLAGPHDRQVHCEKRFTLNDAGEWLVPGRWRVLRAHYRYCCFAPLMWLWRRARSRDTLQPISDLRAHPRWLNFLLHGVARIEDRWMPLPLRGVFGSSLLLILQREEQQIAGDDT